MDIRLTPKQQSELESVIKAIAAIVIIPWVLIVCGMVLNTNRCDLLVTCGKRPYLEIIHILSSCWFSDGAR